MGLDTILTSGVDTVFQVFAPFVLQGRYFVSPDGEGWGETEVNTGFGMETILNGLSQSDIKNTRFFSQIQPTDVIAMVKGKDIFASGIRVRNSDKFEVIHKSYTASYTIQGHDTDSAEALYLLLLREI
jgi:hypothetical protein